MGKDDIRRTEGRPRVVTTELAGKLLGPHTAAHVAKAKAGSSSNDWPAPTEVHDVMTVYTSSCTTGHICLHTWPHTINYDNKARQICIDT